MGDRSVQDDSQEVVERVWNALEKTTKSKKNKDKVFDVQDSEKLSLLCSSLSKLNKKEAKIVYGIIKKYAKQNPGAMISKNEDFPYVSQKSDVNDLLFEEVEKMPLPLLQLLYVYIDRMVDKEED